MAQNTEYWTLEHRVARLRLDTATARVDVAQPQLGVQELRLDSRSIDGQLLALAPSEAVATWPARVADAYVRGPDLVATYAGGAFEDGTSWPYSPQVYWTILPPEHGSEIVASLALVVSIQTDLLDTHPRIDVRSNLTAEEVLLICVSGDEMLVDSHVEGVQAIDPRASAYAIVWRFEDGTPSYAEIMPTTDFRQLAVERLSTGEFQSRWELFAEFLEKGVIRRARLQSLFVPRENDVQLVAECCRAIESQPLPLTT